mmetsp:Transcript_11010/g.30187  ORF Transcript_11010/g.30187 Transcript_11010/m.30187 type:complete len:216 (+) Transcript_11010:718-1365(+)
MRVQAWESCSEEEDLWCGAMSRQGLGRRDGLVDLALGTSISQLLHGSLSILLGAALQEGLGQCLGPLLHKVDGDVSNGTHSLVHSHLLIAWDLLQDHIEGGLLLLSGRGSCASTRGSSNSHRGSGGSRGIHSKGGLNLRDQLAGLQQGQGLQLVHNFGHSGGRCTHWGHQGTRWPGRHGSKAPHGAGSQALLRHAVGLQESGHLSSNECVPFHLN